MKPIAVGAAALAATHNSAKKFQNLSGTEMYFYMAGFMDGIIMKNDLPEMQKCYTESQAMIPEITKIITEMSSGDLNDFIQACKDTIDMMTKFPQEFADCMNVESDWGKIMKWYLGFMTPEGELDVIKNVMDHWDDLKADIDKMDDDMNNKAYQDAGEIGADIFITSFGKI